MNHTHIITTLLFASTTAFVPTSWPAPEIVTNPESVSVIAGEATSFAVEATGTGTLTYQWRKFGTPIEGAVDSVLAIKDTEFADQGFYDVVVGDASGSITSMPGRLIVYPDSPSDVYRPGEPFGPRLEKGGGEIRTMLTAPDGRIYVAGDFTGLASSAATGITRLNPDGTTDETFHPASIRGGGVNAIALQPDGRILIAGGFTSVDGKGQKGIARLFPDGTFDNSLNVGSGFEVDVEGGGNAEIFAVGVQSDGAILVGGWFHSYNGVARFNLVRLHENGTLDSDYLPPAEIDDPVIAIAIQADGRSVMSGHFRGVGTDPRRFIVRLNADGSLDNTFDDGFYLSNAARVIALQADGRILVGGSFSSTSNRSEYVPGIGRLNADGSRDTSFNPTCEPVSEVFAISVLPNGDIFVGGQLYYKDAGILSLLTDLSANGEFQRSLFDRNSDLDVRYVTALGGSSGNKVIAAVRKPGVLFGSSTSLLWKFDAVSGAREDSFEHEARKPAEVRVVTPIDKNGWVIGGDFTFVDGRTQGGIAVIDANGVAEPAFAPGTGFDGLVSSIVVDGAGRYLVGGAFDSFSGIEAHGLARILPDGSMDDSFSTGSGFTHDRAYEIDPGVDVLCLQPDGMILASGNVATFNGASAPLPVRLTTSGALDDTFSPHQFTRGTPSAIETLEDGRIWVGGYIETGGFNSLIRLNPDGSLETQVSAIGYSTGIVELHIDVDQSLRVAMLDKILRVLADGTLDPTVDPAENAAINPQAIRTMLVDGNGRAVIGGWNLRDPSSLLQRIQNNGSVDPAFHVMGTVNQLAFPEVLDLAFATENRILVAGRDIEFDNGIRGGLVMLEPVRGPAIQEEPQPSVSSTAGGTPFLLAVEATGDGPLSYQWQFYPNTTGIAAPGSGVDEDLFAPMPGATASILSIPSPQLFHSGTYRVVVSSSGVSTVSAPTTVVVEQSPLSPDARLLNLSTRGVSLSGDDVLIPGFVVQGTGQKRLLIRAVGPTLGGFGVPDALPDPVLELKQTVDGEIVTLAANDNWGDDPNAAEMPAVNLQVGAFDLAPGSGDAALLHDLAPGAYTAVAGDKNGARGIAIVELYDADDSASPTARLVNISNRGFAGTGDEVMIPGFVVSSEGPKRLLIRVVGPTLGTFGVQGFMPDPKLTVLRANPDGSSTEILWQDNWQDLPSAGDTAAVAEQVGAFPLTENSADAAFVVTLPPGSYTIAGSSADGTSTGVVLVEVYVVE